MKRIIGICFLTVCLLVCASTGAMAGGMCKGPCDMDKAKGCMMCMQEKMMCKMDLDDKFFCKIHFIVMNGSAIKLTDEQMEKIKTIKYNTKKMLAKSDADIAVAGLNVEEALMKDELDVNVLNGLLDRKFSMKAQRAKDLVGAMANVKAVLSKDQKSMLKKIWMKGMCGMKEDMEEEVEEAPMEEAQK